MQINSKVIYIPYRLSTAAPPLDQEEGYLCVAAVNHAPSPRFLGEGGSCAQVI